MRQSEVIAEFYQVHVERGELSPEDVPGPKAMAEEWLVSRPTAVRARTLLLNSGHATSVPTKVLTIDPISDMDMAFSFWPNVLPRNADGCLLWDGSIFGGYAGFRLNGRRFYAHRVAWEHRHGPVPYGLELDHVFARGCRSTLCVNNEHLEPVTRAENERRKHAAARWMASIEVSTELDED